MSAAPSRWGAAVSLTGQTGQSEDTHSPEAWTSVVVSLIRPLSRSIDCDMLVVDETSMVDVLLMHALLKTVPDKRLTRGWGCGSTAFGWSGPSLGRYNRFWRRTGGAARRGVQAAKSQIIVSAHRINQGCMPDLRKT